MLSLPRTFSSGTSWEIGFGGVYVGPTGVVGLVGVVELGRIGGEGTGVGGGEGVVGVGGETGWFSDVFVWESNDDFIWVAV